MSEAEIGKTQRKILLLAELHQRKHGQAPTWAELCAQTGLTRDGLRVRLLPLRKRGLVEFTNEPRSLRVTRAGLFAAINGAQKA